MSSGHMLLFKSVRNCVNPTEKTSNTFLQQDFNTDNNLCELNVCLFIPMLVNRDVLHPVNDTMALSLCVTLEDRDVADSRQLNRRLRQHRTTEGEIPRYTYDNIVIDKKHYALT